MTNVQHSTLTGASLHESKGVAAASANRVYVSDGAGSGSWSQVPVTALATTAASFQTQLLHVREEQASGTNGATLTTGSWQTRVLNTVKTNGITSATLVSNQITLPIGSYFLTGNAQFNSLSGSSKIRLRNITDGATLVVGLSSFNTNPTGVGSTLFVDINGQFTISGTKVIELQYYTNGTASGQPTTSGEVEVYSDILIWKIS